MYAVFLPAIAVAYLLGSVPFGVIIAGAHGRDLRSIGSGNIGATNVSRALGRKWGYFCFALDVLKGFVPTLGTMLLALPAASERSTPDALSLWLWVAVGCAAIAGHIFPVYLRFKGGKGVATSFGVALGLWPYFTICAVFAAAIWAVVVRTWHYVSLASICASIAFPLILALLVAAIRHWEFANLWPLLVVATVIPVMVVARHRENIKRLIAGTENRA